MNECSFGEIAQQLRALAKSTCCSFRRPEVGSQHPWSISYQSSLTGFWVSGVPLHEFGAWTYSQAKHSYT